MTDFDLIAIGGGTGGLAATRAAAVAGNVKAATTVAIKTNRLPIIKLTPWIPGWTRVWCASNAL